MLKEGLEIKEYTLKSFLGRGGFGEVWLAEKKIELADKKVPVALKFISGENQRLSDYSNVKREINTWIDASGDKNVISVYDGFIFEDMFVIVSEYADGGSLRGWLRRNGGRSPSLEKTVEIMSGILDGLAYLHSQKIVHRDLKPENILLKGNIPCIADFGVSRMVETVSITSSNFGTNSAGSPLYMSPESFERIKPTPQVDIWSVGIILFEMLSGKTPYIGDSIPALIFEIVSKEPRQLPSDIPEKIQEVVRKALAKEVSQRFQSAKEMRDALMKAFYFQDYQQTFAREEFITTKKKFVSEDSPAQTLFTDKYLQNTLREKGLVRTFQEKKQKPPIWRWILTVSGAVLVLIFLALVGISLVNNKKMLDEASEKGEAVLNIYKADANSKINPLEKNAEQTRKEITSLDDLREVLVTLDQYEREGAPWYMRFGLYSGDKIYLEKLLPIYVNVVEQRFKVPVVRKVETDLRTFAYSPLTENPDAQEAVLEITYDLLKAYLMLSAEHKKRAESTTIINALEEYWKTESKLPPDLSEVARKQLEFYARQADREQFPAFRVDTKLIADVRQKLRTYPAVNRYYKRKVAEISKAIEYKNGATTAEKMLAANSGDTGFIESTYTVPGAYTLEGNQMMKTAISEASQKLSEDDWTIGEQGLENITQTADFATLEKRYYRDYADHWKNFVKGLNVKPYDKQNADDALIAFSSANSPMEILLKEVARQTNLSAEPAQGWIDWLISFFRRTKPTNAVGNTAVEQEFRPLFVFIGEGDRSNAPTEKYRSIIGTVAAKYSQFSSYEIEQISQDLAKGDKTKFPQLAKAEVDIRYMLRAFNETASGQEIAAFLQEPLGNLDVLLGADAKSQLAKTWEEELLPMAKNLEKGYPFETSETEADLKNLRSFLNPQTGKLSNFFNAGLKNYFEEVNGQLKPKESSDVKFTDEFVVYLNNAFRLRRALYGEAGTTEKFEYDFKLNPVKGAIIEVTIDGQPIKSEDTASAKLTFPASSGQTGAQLNFMNSSQNSRTDPSGEKTWQGTWGLFRFFDAGSPEKQSNGSYLLKYSFGGKPVTASVKPSHEDLFDKNLFRSVRAPEIILK